MGESKHTPRPWRLDRTARGAGFSVVAASPKRAGGGNRICTCRPASYSPEAHDEAEANARLIAAAPDLLEALKTARDELYHLAHSSCDPDDPSAMDSLACAYRECRDAIAKAEGK